MEELDTTIYFINEYDGLKYKFIKDVHDALPEYQIVFDQVSVPSSIISYLISFHKSRF